MGILKNKTFWVMLFVVAIGTVLRLIFIDKPDGLWNDEYVSWAVASVPLGKNFVNAVIGQCHMPFYYLFLKFFIHYFGNSDLMLRMTSVIIGVLSIIVMYFAGKELKDKNLGILCASIASLSSFLIYFSQEVRFYELLFLFSTLSMISTLKLGKKQNFLNFSRYIISNLLIIITHTIGFIFVIFNMIFMCHWLLKTDKKYKKGIIITWSSLILAALACLPLIFSMLTTHPYSQWWSSFSLSKIGFLITDYFSPMLTNIVSAPDNFFYNFNLGFVAFAIVPSIIALAGITKAFKTENQKTKYEILGLFYTCLAFILVLIVMAISGKLTFITKYSIEIYPILIAIMGFGLLEFKKNLRYFLVFAFCFLNLFYVLTNPNSAPSMHRSEGHKIVANLLKNTNLQTGDYILINYYPKDRFEKYFDFSKYNVISINKGNFTQYLGMDFNKAIYSGKADYRGNFSSTGNKTFEKKFKDEILTKLKPKQKLVVVILNDVSIYSPVKMQAIVSDDREYKKTPFFFLVFSQIKNEILGESLKNLQIARIEQKGSWSVITFLKP